MNQTANSTKILDKTQVVRSIQILMDYMGIDWEELKRLAKTSPSQADGEIPPIWDEVYGMLKDRNIDPLAYQEKVRSEWDNYP